MERGVLCVALVLSGAQCKWKWFFFVKQTIKLRINSFCYLFGTIQFLNHLASGCSIYIYVVYPLAFNTKITKQLFDPRPQKKTGMF
jgi:hypothetical protein